jgi:hypothetical protein
MSSVMESRLNPPTESMAARRNTAPEPTKKEPPQPSRPDWMAWLNMSCSFGTRAPAPNARWKMSSL